MQYITIAANRANGFPPFISTLLALSAWVSMNPYFLWDRFLFGKPTNLLLMLALSTSACFIIFAKRNSIKVPALGEKLGLVLLSFFILYITLQPQYFGGHNMWVVTLPALFGFLWSEDQVRADVFRTFSIIFALTLVPGILVSAWMIAGFPITFNGIAAANFEMAQSGTRLLHLPGMLFTETNSIILPNGGTLFRLNGFYDEPGMVGTIAALLLAGHAYRLRTWNSLVIYAGGLLSFSLAFVVLSALGFIGRAIISKKLLPLFGIAPLFAIVLLLLFPPKLTTEMGETSFVNVISQKSEEELKAPLPSVQEPSETLPLIPKAERSVEEVPKVENIRSSKQRLRSPDYINNRTLPEMERLLNEYWASDIGTIFFGIASDASVIRAPTSQVWKGILTNHGLIGFILLMAGSFAIAWSIWWRTGRSMFVLLLFGMFAMSFYQRPVIWLPYAMLLMICGPLYCVKQTAKE